MTPLPYDTNDLPPQPLCHHTQLSPFTLIIPSLASDLASLYTWNRAWHRAGAVSHECDRAVVQPRLHLGAQFLQLGQQDLLS